MKKVVSYIKLISLLVLLFSGSLFSQQSDSYDKYWVFFNDYPCSVSLIPGINSHSIEKRGNRGIPLTKSDHLLCPDLIHEIESNWGPIINKSRWFNAISIKLDPEKISLLKSEPFVKRIEPVLRWVHSSPPVSSRSSKVLDSLYSDSQLSQIGLNKLHRSTFQGIGINGHGVTIAVLDNGFRYIDRNEAFSHLFGNEKIVGQRDFVNPGGEVTSSSSGTHGASVFSILAGLIPGEYIGASPGADFVLCVTEDNSREWHMEEDNWVAAVEFADSLGCDIITSSLGYSIFDPGEGDYSYADLDGNSTIISRGADIAASKGMLVVTSAGNSGNNSWKYITAPADADSVLSVGAVNGGGERAAFSSQGPTFDGRIKPEVMAQGYQTAYVNTDNVISIGAGTSFSAPIIAGLAACIWQLNPQLTGMDIRDIIISQSDRFQVPDTFYGYGIPNGEKIFEAITGIKLEPTVFSYDPFFTLFPNPNKGEFFLGIDNYVGENRNLDIEIINDLGQVVFNKNINIGSYSPFLYKISFENSSGFFRFLRKGLYCLRVVDNKSEEVLYLEKFIVDE